MGLLGGIGQRRQSSRRRRVALLLREMFDMSLRRTPEVKHAAPQ
jgi:hypothetical protein